MLHTNNIQLKLTELAYQQVYHIVTFVLNKDIYILCHIYEKFCYFLVVVHVSMLLYGVEQLVH